VPTCELSMREVSSLLERLDVSAIYWIDDENASDDELDINKLVPLVASGLSTASEKQQTAALEILRKLPNAANGPRQIARAVQTALAENDPVSTAETIELQLTQKLSSCVENIRPILSGMLNKLPQPLRPHEKEALSQTLAPPSNGKWSWCPLSFTRWHKEHHAILSSHVSNTSRALLIVDLQNTLEMDPTSGIDILSQWAEALEKSQPRLEVLIVALTGQVDPDQELREGRQITSRLFKKTAPPLPVFVVSKNRLQGEEFQEAVERTHEAIGHVLSRVRSCQIHLELAQNFKSLFADSVECAFSKLQQLSIEELLLSVSSSSFVEGASEVDTLLRMATIAQRQALLNGLATNQLIQTSLVELRGLEVDVKRDHLDSVEGLEDLRSSELHDPGPIVNALLSPLSAGDIFEFKREGEQTNTYFVLIANACDLMLRSKTGKRQLDSALLLPLMSSTDEDKQFLRPIEYFPPNSPLAGKLVWVSLRRYLSVTLDVLDLCWTNAEGDCHWSRKSDLPDNLQFLTAQAKRYEIVSKRLTAANAEMVRQLIPYSYPVITPEPTGDGIQSVDFQIKRIGRFASALTVELIQKVAQVLARPSISHDYSGAKTE